MALNSDHPKIFMLKTRLMLIIQLNYLSYSHNLFLWWKPCPTSSMNDWMFNHSSFVHTEGKYMSRSNNRRPATPTPSAFVRRGTADRIHSVEMDVPLRRRRARAQSPATCSSPLVHKNRPANRVRVLFVQTGMAVLPPLCRCLRCRSVQKAKYVMWRTPFSSMDHVWASCAYHYVATKKLSLGVGPSTAVTERCLLTYSWSFLGQSTCNDGYRLGR